MKITIDTDHKTIEVHGEVKLCDLTKQLKKFLGEDYKEYKISNIPTFTYYPFYPTWPNTYVANHQITDLTFLTKDNTPCTLTNFSN